MALLAIVSISMVAADKRSLDPSNFDLIGTTPALVSFTAPWCGHCQRMKPDWEKLGDAFAKNNQIIIGNVNADDHKE